MKEWYLITQNTRPNITGGFENESFVDYKEDGFFVTAVNVGGNINESILKILERPSFEKIFKKSSLLISNQVV